MDVPRNLFLLPLVIIHPPDEEAESGGKGGFAQMELELSMGSGSYNSQSMTPTMITVYSGPCCLEE